MANANLKQATGSLLGSVQGLGTSLAQSFDLVNDGISYASAAVRQLRREQATNHAAANLTHKEEKASEVTKLLADLEIEEQNYRATSTAHDAAWTKAQAKVNAVFANL